MTPVRNTAQRSNPSRTLYSTEATRWKDSTEIPEQCSFKNGGRGGGVDFRGGGGRFPWLAGLRVLGFTRKFMSLLDDHHNTQFNLHQRMLFYSKKGNRTYDGSIERLFFDPRRGGRRIPSQQIGPASYEFTPKPISGCLGRAHTED